MSTPYGGPDPAEPGQPGQPSPEKAWGYEPYPQQPAQQPTQQPYQQPYQQPWGNQPGYPPQPGYAGYPPQQGYGQPGYGYAAPRPDHPKAVTALVLGLVGLIGGFLCGVAFLVSPFAWVMGVRVRREIDAQPGLGGRGQATAGMVTGIIGTVLLILGLGFVVLIIVLAATGALDDSSSGSTSNALALLRP